MTLETSCTSDHCDWSQHWKPTALLTMMTGDQLHFWPRWLKTNYTSEHAHWSCDSLTRSPDCPFLRNNVAIHRVEQLLPTVSVLSSSISNPSTPKLEAQSAGNPPSLCRDWRGRQQWPFSGQQSGGTACCGGDARKAGGSCPPGPEQSASGAPCDACSPSSHTRSVPTPTQCHHWQVTRRQRKVDCNVFKPFVQDCL